MASKTIDLTKDLISVMRSSDPSVNVVLFEDTAAVAGVVVAGSCMAISQYTGSPLPDAIGCILVGTLLGGVASFIILSNVGALVGRCVSRKNTFTGTEDSLRNYRFT